MILEKEHLQTYPNTAGIVLDIPLDRQFFWMRKFFPERKTVGVLYNPEQNDQFIKAAKIEAARKEFKLITRAITRPKDIPKALQSLIGKTNILWGINDRMVLNSKTAKNILLFSFRHKIPFIGLSDPWAKAGAIYALDRNYHDMGRQCAELVNKILQGLTARDIPISIPRDITYSVNTRMARKLHLKIDRQLIKKAHAVYQ